MQCRETSADDGATTTDEELLVEDSCFSSRWKFGEALSLVVMGSLRRGRARRRDLTHASDEGGDE